MPRPVDRVVLQALPKAAPRFLLVGLDMDGGSALAALERYPGARVVWFHYDLFAAGLARFQGLTPEHITVGTDLPASTGDPAPPDDPSRPDAIVLPFPRGGEALLARELVEEAHDALALGGRLHAVTDGDPSWLKRVAREVFRDVEFTAKPGGTVVICTRTTPATRLKDHSHVVKLTVRDRTFQFRTRPGVFSYGHIDQGTRALLAGADFAGVKRILDIGCGVGALGIVAASASPGATATLVDSNVRAVALAREAAVLNEVPGITVIATADPLSAEGGPFDCVLANPPYFANFHIAIKFIAAAHEQLMRHGKLWLVAKAAEEHAVRVRTVFGNAEVKIVSGYGVISARKS